MTFSSVEATVEVRSCPGSDPVLWLVVEPGSDHDWETGVSVIKPGFEVAVKDWAGDGYREDHRAFPTAADVSEFCVREAVRWLARQRTRHHVGCHSPEGQMADRG